MKGKVGIFDSGIGGLTTYKEIKKLLPNENYIYYADTKNNPYGSKTQDELKQITKKRQFFVYLLQTPFPSLHSPASL